MVTSNKHDSFDLFKDCYKIEFVLMQCIVEYFKDFSKW